MRLSLCLIVKAALMVLGVGIWSWCLLTPGDQPVAAVVAGISFAAVVWGRVGWDTL